MFNKQACGRREIHIKFYSGNLKGKDNLGGGEVRAEGGITLKLI
jgi:hypothetical protein